MMDKYTIAESELDAGMDREAKQLDEIEAKQKYICSRYLGDNRIAYVSETPGEDGVDWGYVNSRDKAKPLSLYWKRRFVNDCRRVQTFAYVRRCEYA